jgi:ceramide glucosyltransferase
MVHPVAVLLFALAVLGLVLVAAQGVSLRRHVGRRVPPARRRPPISVLKPLCGVDDGLEENLARFASLDYPEYEVVLGVRSTRDPAWSLARAAARRWPDRFRVAVQRGEPGLNPKVNQLVTLARAARHDVLVVSDSNVRVAPGYLAEIAALLEDERVGLVTHPVIGEGAARLGSILDQLHLAGSIAPGVVAAKRLGGHDIVVGKSMAFRRRDLEALGGFEAVKDVLAEDYVLGLMVRERLGKRVALAPTPVRNVSELQSVRGFAARYRRWAVLQRQLVGPGPYAAQALLNPVLLAAAAVACDPGGLALGGFAATCAAKTALDGAAARALRPGGLAAWQLAAIPAKDLLFAGAWAYGLFRREVDWRGTRLVVGPGSRVLAAEGAAVFAGASGEVRDGPVTIGA